MKKLIMSLIFVSTPVLAGDYSDYDRYVEDMYQIHSYYGKRISNLDPVPLPEPTLPEPRHYYQRTDPYGNTTYEYLKRMD